MSIPKTQKVVLAEKAGEGYDVIKYTDKEISALGPNEILVKNKYAGINFIEAYFRKGIYPAQFPYVFGREASGVVYAIGENVKNYKVGDKVAYIAGATFAQYTKIQDSHLHIVKLEPETSDEKLKVFGSMFVAGLTAVAFTAESYDVKKGDYVLVWAASGGVGRLLVQICAKKGAHVIAIASTDAKLDMAKKLGAEFTINSQKDDVVAKVNEFTNGQGVQVVYDSIGKDTFETSLASTARKGTFVSYGNASGVVPPVDLIQLSAKAIKILRPMLFAYIATKDEWDHWVKELADQIASGELDFDISATYELKDYAKATEALENRKTTGKLVLKIPQ